MWTELVKWCFRCSKHTFAALLLGVLEKFNNHNKHTENFTKLLAMCADLKQEMKVRSLSAALLEACKCCNI